ncbi:MAG: hypothetical protein PHS49_04895 [Candidatus Gracilibacteria bacterium]|nr:hypothetical protein [Candidatus Gracilibacteria bacterium]
MHKIIRKIVSVISLIAILGSNYVFSSQTYAEELITTGVESIYLLPLVEDFEKETNISFERHRRNGFDNEGYDRNGFDNEGYDRNGFDNEGYDRNGFDNEGYDRNGFDNEGYDRNGFDNEGYDRNGFDNEGYDRNGFDNEGYDRNGFDNEGYDRNGFDNEGYDRNGFDNEGYDRNGNYKGKGKKYKPETSIKQYGSIDGWKFNDLNGSGYWNDGSQSGSIAEPGLNGFEITLQSIDLTKTYTGVTYTDSFWGEGYFTFTGVLVGTYKLCEVNQSGWNQTHPDENMNNVVNGCHKVEVLPNTNTRLYFGNHYVGVTETGTGTTETGSGSTETGSGSTETGSGTTETGTGTTETGTGTTETGTGTTETGTGTTETGTGTTETGTGTTETGTGTTETGTGTTETGTSTTQLTNVQQVINRSSSGGGGGGRGVRKLISYDVKNTVEAAGLGGNTEENIVKHYNEYLEKLNRLSDIIKAENPELDQEKKILQNYLEGTYVSSKYKNQINNVIKKLAKLDKEKKQEMILKLFAKLEAAEIKFENNNSILNLISYLKLKLSIAYSS